MPSVSRHVSIPVQKAIQDAYDLLVARMVEEIPDNLFDEREPFIQEYQREIPQRCLIEVRPLKTRPFAVGKGFGDHVFNRFHYRLDAISDVAICLPPQIGQCLSNDLLLK